MSDPVLPDQPPTVQKLAAETLGTFVLVLVGCGAVVVSRAADLGNAAPLRDLVGVADTVSVGLAFGVAVLVMAYAVGRISGGHFNPAVTLGAAIGGRLPWRDVPGYAAAQLAGATLAALLLFGIGQGFDGWEADAATMGANGFGFAWWSAFLLEMTLTAVFLYVILGVTDSRNEHPGLAPLAIGLALAAIHFVAIPATGTSVNPARSFGPALFAGADALAQLWLFFAAPLLGAAVAGATYRLFFGGDAPVPGSGFVRAAPAAVPGYGAPDAYQEQWNQAQWPAGRTDGPPAPGGQWGAVPPSAPPAGRPGPPEQPPAQHPGQQAGHPPWAAPQQPPGAPGEWGNPGDDGEDGRTQVRPQR